MFVQRLLVGDLNAVSLAATVLKKRDHSLQELPLPTRSLMGVVPKLGRQLGRRLVATNGGQGPLGLQGRPKNSTFPARRPNLLIGNLRTGNDTLSNCPVFGVHINQELTLFSDRPLFVGKSILRFLELTSIAPEFGSLKVHAGRLRIRNEQSIVVFYGFGLVSLPVRDV